MKNITNSITKRFLKTISLIYILLTTCIIIVIITFEYNVRKTYILHEVSSSITAIQKPLSKYVWGYVIEDIDYMKEVLLQNKNISHIKILDITNAELSLQVSKNINSHNFFIKEYRLFFEDFETKHYVGKVIVYINKNTVFSEMKNFLLIILLAFFIQILIISILFKILFNRCLLEPISSLTSQIQNLNFNNLKNFQLVSKHKNSEFDYMTYNFNKIIKKLNISIEKREKQSNLLLKQSKLASMGEMIDNIAHQWRQPLNNIAALNMHIETSLEFGKTIDTQEYKHISEKINNQLEYMSNTIDNLTDFFKNTNSYVDFNLKTALQEVNELFAQSFKNNDITLELNLENIELYGLKNELKQVVIHILNNAKDAILLQKEKSEAFNGLIIITLTKDTKDAIISITDNAGGIKKDIIDKIFEPYFTTKFKSKGTGIGLYMSYQIITKYMKGDIFVQNQHIQEKNQNSLGAKFTIKIPLKNEFS